ncbi:hypothetical protein CRUP_010902 [Coryphaenoides rupestris]|nr:hypothetical protein CRUP_010902 [Coryphaenoides rupestris]
MSTAGLTAQEICLPTESPFLRANYCHSMARSKPSWSNPHELENPVPSTPSPAEDDQVVPPFQRLSIHERSSPPQTPGRCSKPLPPLPTWPDICPEQDVDREVEEFFTGTEDNRCLVPDQCSKPSAFRYGAALRRSLRDCGNINYAYFGGTTAEPRPHPHLRAQREPTEKQPPEPPEPSSVSLGSRPQDRKRVQRSQSLHSSCRTRRPPAAADRVAVPPPVPPRPSKKVDRRRWSVEDPHGAYSDEDKPPKLPPREPLPSRSCSRTPSPKSLPTYVNGVMPPTQSFAPDPKYVSLQRQNSEGSPCILPVMENGSQASSTHYFLMPLGRGLREDS